MKNNYKYVVESGCSYTATDCENLVNPGETYGDIVAKHYGAKCYNLAASGTSFQRMSRKIYEWCAKNKDKFNDTLIILGMTSFDRHEMWNNKIFKWQPVTGHYWDSAMELDNQFDYEIPWTGEDKKKYFINFYNDKAHFLCIMHTIIGLQSFFKVNNIDNIFFNACVGYLSWIHDHKSTLEGIAKVIDPDPFSDIKSTGNLIFSRGRDLITTGGKRIGKKDELGNIKIEPQVDFRLLWDNLVSKENWYVHPKYGDMGHLTAVNDDMRVSKEDEHPNKKAHKYWGECLLEYINEKV